MTTSTNEPPAQATIILLVEDDAPTSWRLQDALGKAGYQVRAAGTLAEARAALAESAPKVLLTDLQLPDGHGVTLIRETRARFPETEIMVISIVVMDSGLIASRCPGMTNEESVVPTLDRPALRGDVVRVVRTLDEAADRQHPQHVRIALALAGRRQDRAGHLGPDRRRALGFRERRGGVLEHGLHQLDDFG